ncbi:MAG: hypothetical protein ABW217_01485, partial [Polyangiaceae bacterium]
PEPAPVAAAPAAATTVRARPLPPIASTLPSWPVPGGIPLPILRGQGVGPIRFGARLDTIERLMGDPCDQQVPLGAGAGGAAAAAPAAGAGGAPAAAPAELLCRYHSRAVEFELKGGVLVRIHVHRPARPFDPERGFGVYNGRFPEGAALGMFSFAVEETLGKPSRIEPRDGAAPYNTVELRHYPGMVLEYDRLPNKNVVLGGVVLTKR